MLLQLTFFFFGSFEYLKSTPYTNLINNLHKNSLYKVLSWIIHKPYIHISTQLFINENNHFLIYINNLNIFKIKINIK